MIARAPLWLALLGLLPACGPSLAGGDFEGDATAQLQGAALLPIDAVRPTVGALWLGYSAASDPTKGIETTTLPVTSLQISSFSFEFLGPPPSTGQYMTANDRIIPSTIRIADLILFDDLNGDGSFAVDGNGQIVAPDSLLARAEGQLVLFVDTPPADPSALDGADTLITNWEAASPGYHLLALDTSVAPPDFSGQVISTTSTSVRFGPSSTAVP